MLQPWQAELVRVPGLVSACGFATVEFLRLRRSSTQAPADGNRLTVLVSILLPLIIVPFVLQACQVLGLCFFPQQRQVWAGWAWWDQVLMFLLLDDLVQYFWHRLSHNALLWPCHRIRHFPTGMPVHKLYRHNAFHYLNMPGLWLSGVLVYLGFGWVYVGYSLVKMTVLISVYAPVRWDEQLNRMRVLRPFMWLLERSISTPAIHSNHHGLAEPDDMGHADVNFGALLSCWDVLFGTARFPRQYPAQIDQSEGRWHVLER